MFHWKVHGSHVLRALKLPLVALQSPRTVFSSPAILQCSITLLLTHEKLSFDLRKMDVLLCIGSFDPVDIFKGIFIIPIQ